MTGGVKDGVFAPTEYYWLFDGVVNADLEPKDDMAITAALVPLAFTILTTLVAFCLARGCDQRPSYHERSVQPQVVPPQLVIAHSTGTVSQMNAAGVAYSFCSQCGGRVEAGAVFCGSCGAKSRHVL